MKVNRNKKEIPIFFASDKNYLPYTIVAIKSLINNASSKYVYKIHILTNEVKDEDISELKAMQTGNVTISLIDVSDKINSIKDKVALRDYYSVSIYFRLFIPSMFPQYKKAIYLDGDVIINVDIAKLYNVDLGLNLVAAVLDEVIYSSEDFTYYANEALDISEKQYFNSGVLVMNLEKFRKIDMENDFYNWVNSHNFGAVAPDQDYLNIKCKNNVKYLARGWNKMPMGKALKDSELYLIHYNMFMKPWKYYDVMYENYFWNVARQTSLYVYLKNQQKEYTEEQRNNDKIAYENLVKLSRNIVESGNNYKTLILGKNRADNSNIKTEKTKNTKFQSSSILNLMDTKYKK